MEEVITYKVTTDKSGQALKGELNYKIHLPPDIPAANFWSVIVCDNHTGLIIKTDQPWPSVHKQSAGLLVNQNGSVDIWFGPEPLNKKENNWIKTIPGRGWNLILRLYNPLEPWFNKTWTPGKLEEQK
jgi:hypothetical protein